jgi:methionyl-tRNA formyltransferase
MDAGPILSQERVPLTGNEKATALLPHLFTLGTQLLLRALPSVWDGRAFATPQDESAATSAPKLTAADARVDLRSESALNVHNKVRGFAGWPGVWTAWIVGESDARRVKLITTTVISHRPDPTLASMEITLVLHEGKPTLRAVCGDGSVLGVLELQFPGKAITDARSFANGLSGRAVQWRTPPIQPE